MAIGVFKIYSVAGRGLSFTFIPGLCSIFAIGIVLVVLLFHMAFLFSTRQDYRADCFCISFY